MKTWEILETALRRFRTHPREMWLTLAGLVVGTASTIFAVTLGLTGRGFVMAQIEGVGSHLIWADYRGTITRGEIRRLEDRMTDGDYEAIRARDDLFSGVTPLVTLHGQTTLRARSQEITVLGVAASYEVVRKNVRVLKGRFLDEDDVRGLGRVCLVSRHLYEQLDSQDEIPALRLHTLGMSFNVIGEFEEPVDTLGQGNVTPDTILIPITVAWYFTPAHNVDTVFAEVRDFRDIPFAQTVVEDLLRERHHPGARYSVEGMTTVIRVANAISYGLLVIFTLVAAISVIVGGIGIMNIMLASVEQRTREVGLRRSVGARRRDILKQFLSEAVLLGVFGSALGVVLGVLIPLTVRPFVTQVRIPISPLSVVLSFVFSAGVTIMFGVAPALRAASLDPVEALRHE